MALCPAPFLKVLTDDHISVVWNENSVFTFSVQSYYRNNYVDDIRGIVSVLSVKINSYSEIKSILF